MEIILKIIGLFVAFVLVIIAIRVAAFIIGASLLPGLIVGGLSYWIFDTFWPGFIAGGAIGVIFAILGQFSDSNSSSSRSTPQSRSTYPSPKSTSYPTSSNNRSENHPNNNSNRQNYIEELKRNYYDEKCY